MMMLLMVFFLFCFFFSIKRLQIKLVVLTCTLRANCRGRKIWREPVFPSITGRKPPKLVSSRYKRNLRIILLTVYILDTLTSKRFDVVGLSSKMHNYDVMFSDMTSWHREIGIEIVGVETYAVGMVTQHVNL